MAKTTGTTRRNAPSANPNLKGAGNTEKQSEHVEADFKAYLMLHGYGSDEAQRTKEAVRTWAGSGYRNIRQWQQGKLDTRNINESVKEDAKKKALILEDMIERLPKWAGGTTYRGYGGENKRALFEALEVGDTWHDRALSSWSTDYTVAKSFSGDFTHTKGVILRCYNPQNGTSIKSGALNRESEVLVSGKARYKVVSKSLASDGTLVIDFEPISNGKVREE